MKIKKCEIGTFVSYARVDGTCRQVENYRHAWLDDGTCANCDLKREDVGYSPTKLEKIYRKTQIIAAFILSATLLTGCAMRQPEPQKFADAVKSFWPDAEVSQTRVAKVLQHGKTYDVSYRVGFFGAIEFQSICLEGVK